MTKHETIAWPEPIPDFDVVKWKRQVHAEIQRETEGIAPEEVREYFRQATVRGAQRRAKLAACCTTK